MFNFLGFRSSTPRTTTPTPTNNSKKKHNLFSKYITTHKEKAPTLKTSKNKNFHGKKHPKASSTSSSMTPKRSQQKGYKINSHELYSTLHNSGKKSPNDKKPTPKEQTVISGRDNDAKKWAKAGALSGGQSVEGQNLGRRATKKDDQRDKQPTWSSREQRESFRGKNVKKTPSVSVLPKVELHSELPLKILHPAPPFTPPSPLPSMGGESPPITPQSSPKIKALKPRGPFLTPPRRLSVGGRDDRMSKSRRRR